MNRPNIGIFGEVLFDHFPDGTAVLGGAPLNVAWHLQAFGQQPLFISRIGDDTQGEQVRETMRNWGMDCSGLQTDPLRPTGKVNIRFIDGEPQYDIQQDCAYDAIESTAQGPFDLLYHGSLALRNEDSAQALQSLKSTHPATLFTDVNLRNPWWNVAAVKKIVRDADWVKLNQHELSLLNGDAPPDADVARRFVDENGLRGMILTQGEAGAAIFTGQGEHFTIAPQASEPVVDTVGAGDAFASVMMLGLIEGWRLDITLQRAQAFASESVRHRGALLHDRNIYRHFLQSWK
jgi:fructokinase